MIRLVWSSYPRPGTVIILFQGMGDRPTQIEWLEMGSIRWKFVPPPPKLILPPPGFHSSRSIWLVGLSHIRADHLEWLSTCTAITMQSFGWDHRLISLGFHLSVYFKLNVISVYRHGKPNLISIGRLFPRHGRFSSPHQLYLYFFFVFHPSPNQTNARAQFLAARIFLEIKRKRVFSSRAPLYS